MLYEVITVHRERPADESLDLFRRMRAGEFPDGARVLLVLGFPDIYQAGDVVPEILAAAPIACEGLDDKIIGGLRERRLIARRTPVPAWRGRPGSRCGSPRCSYNFV